MYFGHKSTTLESIGMLLPLLVFPDKVAGRNIIFMIDNKAVLYSWYKGLVKNDKSATEVLKTVQYLASFLGVTVHVDHAPRMSEPLAAVADKLSRKNEVVSCLTKWLENPCGSLLCEAVMKESGEKHPKY